MDNQTSSFFKFVFGPNYPGLLAIWERHTQTTQFFRNNQLDEAEAYIMSTCGTNDLYFGCGLLESKDYTGRGKSDDVIAVPGYWMDLDIQSSAHSAKKYPPTNEEALKILSGFAEPSLIVNSGHGLHLYWLFDKPWQFEDASDKNRAARLLKAFQQTIRSIFSEHGYQLDITSDLARLLRIPGTLNHKKTPPVPVEIFPVDSNGQRRYKPKDIIELVNMRKQQIKMIKTKTTFPQCDGQEILKHCQWFRHCQKDSQNLTEPEWFAMLTVVASCNNAGQLACDLSKNYAGYDEQETLNKLNRIQKANYNPVACATVRETEYYNEYCSNCANNVKSPFLLGIDRSNSALEQVGFKINDDGHPYSINGNIFARYILSRFKLLYTIGDSFYQYYDGVWHYRDPHLLSRQLRDLVQEFVPNFWTKKLEDLYLEPLKREAPYYTALNTHRNYINLKNGMLNLDTFQTELHDPTFLSTSRIPIEFNKAAICPNYDKFMSDIFEGDQERITIIQELMGYSLTAETSAHKAFLFYGNGANGKSLLGEVIRSLCGEQNSSGISLTELSNSRSRYKLVGKLLNLATENEFAPSGVSTEEFKKIVVGESILVEEKYQQSFEYKPFCKLIFSLNNLPYSRDKSWAFQRRFIIIPFNRTFREDDPATQVYSVLKKSLLDELPGILNKALAGLKKLRENDYHFSHSAVSEELKDEYTSILNPYKQFIEETIEQGNNGDHITNEEMLRTFTRWCSLHRHNKIGNSSDLKIHHEIRNTLRDLQFKFEVGKGCKAVGKRGYKGIQFKNKNEQEPNSDFADLEA